MNKLDEFIAHNGIPDSEFLIRIRQTYNSGNIGFRFAKELIQEYHSPTEPYQEDFDDTDV